MGFTLKAPKPRISWLRRAIWVLRRCFDIILVCHRGVALSGVSIHRHGNNRGSNELLSDTITKMAERAAGSATWSATGMWLLALPALAIHTAVLLPVLPLLHWCAPRLDSSLVICDRWPRLRTLFVHAVRSLLDKNTKTTCPEVLNRRIQVMLIEPTAFCTRRQEAFLRLADFDPLKGDEVSMTYPLVEPYRLTMMALLAPDFPLRAVGGVTTRITLLVHRRISVTAKLVYQVNVRPALRRTDQGHVEVDVVVKATTTNYQHPDYVCCTTLLLLQSGSGVRAVGPVAPALPPELQPPPEEDEADKIKRLVPLETWALASDAGRCFSALSGNEEALPAS